MRDQTLFIVKVGLAVLAFVFFIVGIHHQSLVVRNIDTAKAKTVRDHMAGITHTLPNRNALNPTGKEHYDKLGKTFALGFVAVFLLVGIHLLGY